MYIPAYNTLVWKYNIWKFFQNLSVCGEKASQIDKRKNKKKIDKCVFRYLCDRYSKLDKEEKIIHDDFN